LVKWTKLSVFGVSLFRNGTRGWSVPST